MENEKVLDEALYSKIDPKVKQRFADYCLQAKLYRINSVDNQRKLIEVALSKYMDDNPLNNQEKS